MGLEQSATLSNGESVRTNPDRDIAHFFPQLVQAAQQGLLRKNWEAWFKPFLEVNNVDEEELLLCFARYCHACEVFLAPDMKTPFEALQAVGFFDCPLPAQFVVSAKIGQIATGAFFAGVKSATRYGESPATVVALSRWGEETEKMISTLWAAKGRKELAKQ